MAGSFAYTLGIAAASPPAIANFVAPADRFSAAQFDVLDDSGAFRAVFCLVGFEHKHQSSEIPTEVVHVDTGTRITFSYPYYGSRSTIALGYHYEVFRHGGWPLLATRFHAIPIDTLGSLG
jgi:hypothetical protein